MSDKGQIIQHQRYLIGQENSHRRRWERAETTEEKARWLHAYITARELRIDFEQKHGLPPALE